VRAAASTATAAASSAGPSHQPASPSPPPSLLPRDGAKQGQPNSVQPADAPVAPWLGYAWRLAGCLAAVATVALMAAVTRPMQQVPLLLARQQAPPPPPTERAPSGPQGAADTGAAGGESAAGGAGGGGAGGGNRLVLTKPAAARAGVACALACAAVGVILLAASFHLWRDLRHSALQVGLLNPGADFVSRACEVRHVRVHQETAAPPVQGACGRHPQVCMDVATVNFLAPDGSSRVAVQGSPAACGPCDPSAPDEGAGRVIAAAGKLDWAGEVTALYASLDAGPVRCWRRTPSAHSAQFPHDVGLLYGCAVGDSGCFKLYDPAQDRERLMEEALGYRTASCMRIWLGTCLLLPAAAIALAFWTHRSRSASPNARRGRRRRWRSPPGPNGKHQRKSPHDDEESATRGEEQPHHPRRQRRSSGGAGGVRANTAEARALRLSSSTAGGGRGSPTTQRLTAGPAVGGSSMHSLNVGLGAGGQDTNGVSSTVVRLL